MSVRHYETLDALMGRIIDLDESKVDLISDTRRISAAENLDMIVDSDEGIFSFHLTDHARGQVSTDLGIPKRYFDRMGDEAPSLLRENVNYWLSHIANRRMIRGYDTGTTLLTGRAWLSDRYRRMDHIEIARRLLPEFENVGVAVKFHQAAVTDSRLYLRAVFPEIEEEIKPGDIVRWGIEIKNSEVGAGTFSISGFLLRLVCSNGMVITEAVKARHIGRRIEADGVLSDQALRADDRAFWLAARDVLRATIQETRFMEIVEQLRETQEGATIKKPIEATEIMQQRYSLSDGERETLLTNLVAGQDLSRWGALNALTQTAQTVESFDRQAELEALGWDIANLSRTDWERIAVAA